MVRDDRGEGKLIVRVTESSANPLKVAAQLLDSSLVEIAEPDLSTEWESRAFRLPDDSLLDKQWHLQNKGGLQLTQGADARVIEAWELMKSLGSESITVAVLDDGVDIRHPDLRDKIVFPVDFGTYSGSRGTHGTACAGVAVGAAGGGAIVGAAPNARLMPIRMGDISNASIERYFEYARRNGADIVSCSWGAKDPFAPLGYLGSSAITRCAREGRDGRGCVIVFAAGNHNVDINGASRADQFAIHPEVIAVSAISSLDRKSSYSSFGREIALCAPSSAGRGGYGGRGILTADVVGEGGYSSGDYTRTYDRTTGQFQDTFGGTSSACPLVAGVCALILSVDPSLTSRQVRQLLKDTARRSGDHNREVEDPSNYDQNGHSIYFGYGCVNAAEAVRQIIGDGEDPPDRVFLEQVLDKAADRPSLRAALTHAICGIGTEPNASVAIRNLVDEVAKITDNHRPTRDWFCSQLSS